MRILHSAAIACGVWTSAASAACSTNLKASYPAPVLNDGWSAQLIAQGLTAPRGILFDSNGGLLVVQQGSGIIHFTWTDDGSTCLTDPQKTFLVNSTDLNHGIALSNDGKTLYASSSESVFSWSYDASAVSVSSTNQTIVTNMSNNDHTTRTLLISQKEPGTLVVSRGSNSNIDLEAESLDSGHSQIKAYNLNNFTSTSSPYDFNSEGRLLGWGLRNSVGVAEEPLIGGIYSIENSVDQITRDGTDIHQDNPGEEMNYHGFLNSSTTSQGGNYGYPNCFTLWNTSIPDPGNLTVGSQFTMSPNSTINDTFCSSSRIPPRLTFQAHMAPLDIIFQPNGTEAYITFHGSWDRTDPIGYKVSVVQFANGEPVEKEDSLVAAKDIMTNVDNGNCPDACFRPVGLALDARGRLFMSSDATGEIYVLAKTSVTGTSTASGASPSQTKSAASARGADVKNGILASWMLGWAIYSLW